MMGRQEIIHELRNLIVENLELDAPEQLSEQDRLYEDLRVDSIMVLQLIVYIEEVFHVYVPEEGIEPEAFLTIGSLVDLITSLQEAAV
jgi:aryl carrier protein AsbD